MCLVALAIDRSRRFPLVVVSNRDEFFERPTARLGWWTPATGGPAILGGRDVEAGGTWLGVTAEGRLALVTNVRGGGMPDAGAPSRGAIVADWLSARDTADKFWMRTALSGYNGFNLIAADFRQGESFWASNRSAHPVRLDRGLYGLSNGGLDTPWPKVVTLKDRLREALDTSDTLDALTAQMFAALADRTEAHDDELPATGLPIERERALSPAFIRMPDSHYGTRCSTLVITERVNRSFTTHVLERTFSPAGGMALMRRATLKHWPPRFTDKTPLRPTEQEPVSESEVRIEPPTAGPRYLRARSLLKPDTSRRRRTPTAPG